MIHNYLQLVNLATSNKFLAMIPLDQLNKDWKLRNIAMNLTAYTVPEISVGKIEVAYQGAKMPISTHIRNFSHDFTFNYLLSSDWHQWRILYSWLNRFSDEYGNAAQEDFSQEANVIPIHVYLLTEFKKPIIEVIYHDCFITGLGAVTMNYQDASDAVISSSFTITFNYIEFVENPVL